MKAGMRNGGGGDDNICPGQLRACKCCDGVELQTSAWEVPQCHRKTWICNVFVSSRVRCPLSSHVSRGELTCKYGLKRYWKIWSLSNEKTWSSSEIEKTRALRNKGKLGEDAVKWTQSRLRSTDLTVSTQGEGSSVNAHTEERLRWPFRPSCSLRLHH